VALEKVPAMQAVQAVAPAPENVPGGHGAQALAPSEA